MDYIETVKTVISDYMRDNGIPAKPVGPKTEILSDLGIDSLGLATIVVAIEESTGKDPFQDGFINFQTVEELARLYEKC